MKMKTTTTKKAFKSWLESKKPKSIVGYTRDHTSCPLATYFIEINNSLTNKIEVEVTPDEIAFFEKSSSPNICGSVFIKNYLPSPWMSNFINQVDDDAAVKITAKKALEILNKI